MTALPFSHKLRLSDLQRSAGVSFDLRPDADVRAAVAGALGISAIRKLRLTGRIIPEGTDDWALEAELGASVVQACVVTLAPVATRIEEPVRRRWLKHMPELPGDEIEMPDDEIEPLGQVFDLGAVLVEALALALPAWPRAEGVDAAAAETAPEDATSFEAATRRPFAGLGALRDRLAGSEGDPDDPGGAAPRNTGDSPTKKD